MAENNIKFTETTLIKQLKFNNLTLIKQHNFYDIPTFINHTSTYLRKLVDSIFHYNYC